MFSQILIVSPEPWNGHFVSKHHYAVILASRGYKVYFLDPPDNELSEITIKETAYSNLWVVSAPIVAKGLRFYPVKLKRWIEANWLTKLEEQIGGLFSTVWLFENSRFFDMVFAGSRLKIYHQVDLNQDFHLAKAASSADICFCTSDFIKKKLIRYTNQVYKIHHGVTMPVTEALLTERQNEYIVNNKINAVYVGNLDISYLDTALLSELIHHFPTVQFNFVGNYKVKGDLYSRFSNTNNVTWWGQVPSELIPTILSRCDIELLMYKANSEWDIQQLASPHKLMEYLASGKVIVATYTDEYKDKRYLLEMVDDSKDFFATFEKVVNNLPSYNSQEKQQERICFAKENIYYKQLDTIISYLKQYDLYL